MRDLNLKQPFISIIGWPEGSSHRLIFVWRSHKWRLIELQVVVVLRLRKIRSSVIPALHQPLNAVANSHPQLVIRDLLKTLCTSDIPLVQETAREIRQYD